MRGMAEPALSTIQRRLSGSDKPPVSQAGPAHLGPVLTESENEDAQECLTGQLSGSGLETADEDLEGYRQHDHDSEYEREDREADLYTATSIKSGYLHKKGERRRAWKKRFFVLRPRSLGYYKDSKEYKLLRQIPLLDIRTCAQVQVKKHDYVFGIVTTERTFYIQTSSNHERDEWVQAINTAMQQAKLSEVTQSEAAEDQADTPQARHSPGLTPKRSSTGLSLAGAVQPIAIAGSRTDPSALQPQSASVNTSSSFSPGALSPQAVAGDVASSFTSGPSVGTQPSSFGGPAPPPNSYAVSPPEHFQQYDLGNVDVSLQQIQTAQGSFDTPQEKSRQYSGSSVSDVYGTSGASHVYRSPGGGLHRPQSPGGVSSSEDDGEDEAEMPSTPVSSSFHDTEPQWAQAPVQSAQAKLNQQPAPPHLLHSEHDKTILSGYLTKQGKRKNWRKRWFTLTSSSLSYSRSHMDAKVHHQIPLERVLDVLEFEPPNARRNSKSSNDHGPTAGVFTAADTSSKKYEHCFQIITPKRTLKLCATDENSETQWIQAIRQQLTVNRQGSMSSTAMYSPHLHASPQPQRAAPAPARTPSYQQLKQPVQTNESSRQMSAPVAAAPSAKPQLPSIQTRLEQPVASSRSPQAGQETFVTSPVSVQTDSNALPPRTSLTQRVSFQSAPAQPVRQTQTGRQRSSTHGSGQEPLDAATQRYRELAST